MHEPGEFLPVLQPLSVRLAGILAARVGARSFVAEQVQRFGRGLKEKRVVADQGEYPPGAVNTVSTHHRPEADLRH